jgi:hypothetical protein
VFTPASPDTEFASYDVDVWEAHTISFDLLSDVTDCGSWSYVVYDTTTNTTSNIYTVDQTLGTLSNTFTLLTDADQTLSFRIEATLSSGGFVYQIVDSATFTVTISNPCDTTTIVPDDTFPEDLTSTLLRATPETSTFTFF